MRENNGLPELPKGWVWANLDAAAYIILGQSPPSSTYNEQGDGLPFYQGKAEFGSIYPTPRKWCSDPHKIAEKEDVLISVRAPVGPTNLCQEKSAIGRGLAAIRGLGGIPPRYLLYYFRSIEQELAAKGTGTTFQAITGDQLRGLSTPIAPLTEQYRILAKIEELFTQLDAGVAALERAKALLRRYRQAVLKAACEGRLVAQNADDEPASEILSNALKERKIKKVITLPNDLPVLPEGWCWAPTELLTDGSKYAMKAGPFGSSLKKEYYVSTGYKIYGQEQVIRGDPYYGNYYIDNERFEQLQSNAVKPGDILISLVGTIGKVLLLPDNIEPGIINPRLVKLSLDKKITDNKYFEIYLQTGSARQYFSTLSHGETMQILNLAILKQLPVALPPLAEQHRIVEEVERQLSVMDALDASVDTSLSQANRLRQSILKQAFSGQLVPQDPNDEPASALLERIRAGKEKMDKTGKQLELGLNL